jgi:hypothetical protein
MTSLDLFQHKCQCGMPERHAQQSRSPVRFDAELNEFHVVGPGAVIILRYCYWCGGKLPRSRRSQLFESMDQKEIDGIQAIARELKSLDDAQRLLGAPDETQHRPQAGSGYDRHGAPVEYERTLTYRQRWRTVDLQLHEFADGRIACSLTARRKAPPR